MNRLNNQVPDVERRQVVLNFSFSYTNLYHRVQSFAAQPQVESNSPQMGRPRPSSFPPSVPLTEHKFKVHRSMYGRPVNRGERMETWLHEVVDAMEKNELEDPHSPKTPPQDRLQSCTSGRNAQHRRSPSHLDAWGNPSER